MAQDQVRVLRIVEYVGDRSWVEAQVEKSVQGQVHVKWKEGKGVIRAATIGTYPEILDEQADTVIRFQTVTNEDFAEQGEAN